MADRRWALILAGALAGAATLAAPPPGEHSVTLRDRIGVEWRDELVHEELAFPAGVFTGRAVARVTGPDGQAVTSQVSDVVRDPDDGSIRSCKVWFRTSLVAGQELTYTIRPGVEGVSGDGVKVQESPESVELSTRSGGVIGIRLPGGAEEFAWPVEAEAVAGPVQGLLLPSGTWLGPGRIRAPFRVYGRRTQVTAAGPLFAEASVHYTFDVGEWWTFSARVMAGCPMIVIRESLNTGHSGGTADTFDCFFTLPLSGGGFQPTQVFYGGRNDRPELEDLLKNWVPSAETGIRANWFASPVHGFTLSPATAGEHYTLSGYPSVLNRVGSLIRYQVPGGDAIGFAALDTPYWRNPLAVRFGTDAEGAPRVALPLRMYEQTWIRDGFGGVSPNYTGLTLGVPANTVRRAYGIVLSPAVDETQARLASLFALAGQLGAMPLDRVKEWVLDWPDPMAGQTWAEASTPDGRKALDILRNKIAIKRAYGNFAIFSMAYHYDYAKAGYPPIAKVINDPTQLSADDRRELRRLCAFYAYDMNSLDTFPYGMGFHLNNPNMTIMAVEARVKASAVIRDHPQFRPWGEESRALMQDYFRRFTKDSGAPYENPHYTLGVTLEWAAVANDLLMENGLGDALDMELFRRTMRFVPNWLTPPDPRFNGHRVVLPIGNGSYQSVPGEFTRRFVNYYKERDPPLAGVLQWYGNQTVPADKQCQLVEEVVPALRSEWVKDYGVFFRHGFGTPYETLMHLLAGTCFGHNEHETDQMAYTIYAKGQPIHLSFGNGYFPIYNRPWLRNRISFDMKMEVPERYRIAVVSAAFSPALDYFRAVREFAQLVPRGEEYPVLDDKNQWTPRESADFARSCELWDQPPSFIPPTVWHRQMMLLKDADPKGPTYFVLRDSFAGKPTVPTDLNLWFLANSMETRGGVYHFDGQCEVDMDVFVAAPQTFTPHTAKYGHQQQPYRRDTGFDPKYHPDGKLGETQLLLRVRQPPGAGYLVVLYPRLKAGDPEAAFVRLADNAVQVTTPVARDVVFLDSVPFTCRTPEVSFTGRAGAVRFHPDGRTVIVNSEGPGEFAVAGRSVVGTGAFEVVIEGGKATSRTLTDGAAVEVR